MGENMKYPQRLMISLPDDQLVALEHIAVELTRAGYRTDARRVAEDLFMQLFEHPDLLVQLVRMIAEREEVVLKNAA